jgi:hypothetical protein
MSTLIHIDKTLYEKAKAHGRAERRTVDKQIEFWALVGKAGLDNPDLPIDFVRDLVDTRTQCRALATPFVPKTY